MSLLLTQEERDKFAAYLERDAESANAIAVQMEKSTNLPLAVREASIKRYRMEAAASAFVARRLRSTEDA